MTREEIAKKLANQGMRVTPQRIAILEAILSLNNHPTAEQIIAYIAKNYPSISIGTVYKILDSFVENKLLKKVKTEGGTMRFDPLLTKHHHLHCSETDQIIDYEDDSLDQLISDYFKKKGIKNFEVQDFKLEITGTIKK